jgi:hypothetical protein
MLYIRLLMLKSQYYYVVLNLFTTTESSNSVQSFICFTTTKSNYRQALKKENSVT